MHIIFYLVPFHHKARPVGAENRIRRVFKIPFRIIAQGRYPLFLLLARFIAPQAAKHVPPALSIRRNLLGVMPRPGNWGAAQQQRFLPLGRWWRKAAAHLLQIVHGAAHAFVGQLQLNIIPGLQQHASGLHQSLPHRAISGLAEIAAFGVL